MIHLNAAPSKQGLCKWPMLRHEETFVWSQRGREAISSNRRMSWLKKTDISSNCGDEEQRRRTGGLVKGRNTEVWGDGETERLRELAGSCSSVVAREHHVIRCLATLSNGLLQQPHPPSAGSGRRQFPWRPVISLNGRFRDTGGGGRCMEPKREGTQQGQVLGRKGGHAVI